MEYELVMMHERADAAVAGGRLQICFHVQQRGWCLRGNPPAVDHTHSINVLHLLTYSSKGADNHDLNAPRLTLPDHDRQVGPYLS